MTTLPSFRDYCMECGTPSPHHWAGCPEDTAGVGLPGARIAWVPRRLTAAERALLEVQR